MKKFFNFIRTNWRPLLAIVYAVICIFDFIIMPAIVEASNRNIDQEKIVTLALRAKDPAVQTQIIQSFSKRNDWVPLTNNGGGLLHIAFGGIIGAASWTRGQERRDRLKLQAQGVTVDDPDGDDDTK